jgi:hypothetical protein
MNTMHYVISLVAKYNDNIDKYLVINIICLSEINFFKNYGDYLTGVQLVKADFGPVPAGYKHALSMLECLKKISSKKINNQTIYKSISTPYLYNIGDIELEFLEKSTYEFCTHFSPADLANKLKNNEVFKLAHLGE